MSHIPPWHKLLDSHLLLRPVVLGIELIPRSWIEVVKGVF